MKNSKNTFYIAGYLKGNQIGTIDTDGKLNYSENLDVDSWKHFETKEEAEDFINRLIENETEDLHPTFNYVVEEFEEEHDLNTKFTYQLQKRDEAGNDCHVYRDINKQISFENLEEAFEAFKDLKEYDLVDGGEYELVKLNKDGDLEDWTEYDLELIGWEKNRWVIKTKE